jgi:hypothetical protein
VVKQEERSFDQQGSGYPEVFCDQWNLFVSIISLEQDQIAQFAYLSQFFKVAGALEVDI